MHFKLGISQNNMKHPVMNPLKFWQLSQHNHHPPQTSGGILGTVLRYIHFIRHIQFHSKKAIIKSDCLCDYLAPVKFWRYIGEAWALFWCINVALIDLGWFLVMCCGTLHWRNGWLIKMYTVLSITTHTHNGQKVVKVWKLIFSTDVLCFVCSIASVFANVPFSAL